MAKGPDTPCTECGRLLWSGPASLPAGERRCRNCRRAAADRDHPVPSPAVPAAPEPVDPWPLRALTELSAAVRAGDRQRSLAALRDTLADQMADAEPREVAALARELRATLADLAGLSDDGPKESILDELARRRTDRQQDAAG